MDWEEVAAKQRDEAASHAVAQAERKWAAQREQVLAQIRNAAGLASNLLANPADGDVQTGNARSEDDIQKAFNASWQKTEDALPTGVEASRVQMQYSGAGSKFAVGQLPFDEFTQEGDDRSSQGSQGVGGTHKMRGS